MHPQIPRAHSNAGPSYHQQSYGVSTNPDASGSWMNDTHNSHPHTNIMHSNATGPSFSFNKSTSVKMPPPATSSDSPEVDEEAIFRKNSNLQLGPKLKEFKRVSKSLKNDDQAAFGGPACPRQNSVLQRQKEFEEARESCQEGSDHVHLESSILLDLSMLFGAAALILCRLNVRCSVVD